MLLALLVAAGIYSGWRLSRDEAEAFVSDELQFKYGSTGGDKNFGIPFAIWEVLPVLFKDKLPKGREGEGWGAFGFIIEEFAEGSERPRHKRPVGTTMRNYMGLERIFLNCAVCHAGIVKKVPTDEPLIVSGMPANTIDLEAFQNFLGTVADDPRFTPDDILKAIEDQNIELDGVNRIALYFIGVKQMRTLIRGIGERFKFTLDEPAFGPGRFDTFSPAKALMNWPRENIPAHERIGVVDFPSIWLQNKKRHMWLHWDGNNNKLEERNRSAAFGTGANFPILDRQSVARMEKWALSAVAPGFAATLGVTVDAARAARGAELYNTHCAECHGASGTDFSGKFVGRTEPIAAIGTDRFRFDNYTYDLMLNQSTLYAGNAEERFQNFRKSDGYANMPLDGLWLRAPYLHNGSVPSLRDLLKPPDQRPAAFYRGYEVYDPVDMGFVSRPDQIPDAQKSRLFCYTATLAGVAQCGANAPDNRGVCDAVTCKGNGNFGHDYGTALPVAEKDALIEYLKTF
jgi:mono/diheme cytochrome c family protein